LLLIAWTEELTFSGFYPQTAGLILAQKQQTPPCLTVVLWKYLDFLGVQSPVTIHGIIALHERYRKSKCVSKNCKKCNEKSQPADFSFLVFH